MKDISIYINKKYNYLYIIKQIIPLYNRHHILVECQCDCGKKVIKKLSEILHNRVKSCGCYRKKFLDINGFPKIKHGMKGTRFYNIYYRIRDRCNNNKHVKYYHYGGRGIKCLWNSFEEFKNDMYDSYLQHVSKYGEKQTTIDRINVNDNYYKHNCRWATYSEQNKNKR